MRTLNPWLKLLVDNDTRYTQALCPLADRSGVSPYTAACPLWPACGHVSTDGATSLRR